MKKYIVVGLCLLFLFGAVQAFGAGLAGKNEVSGAAAWLKVSGEGDVSATLFGAAYGKFVSENLELKADVLYASADFDGEDAHAWIVAPAAVWNFTPKTPSAIVPYLGVGIAFASVDAGTDSDTSTNFEAFAGSRFFIGGDYLKSDKAIFVEYRYTKIDLFDSDSTLNMVWGGISIFF